MVEIGPVDGFTHGDLLTYVYGGGFEPGDSDGDIEQEIDDNYERGIHGRAYKVKDNTYIALWEDKDTIIKWKKELEECLDSMEIDYTQAFYQIRLMSKDEFIDYYTLFDITKPTKATVSDEEYSKAEQLHLLPPEKKAALLKAMGAAGLDKQQAAADKLGMSVAQLRQILGRTDEDSDIYKE